MIRLACVLMAALFCLPLVSPAAGQASPSENAAATPVLDQRPERRVLVMLRMTPEHYRPSSDYGAGGYGDAAATAARRRLAARIAHDNHLTLLDSWPMPLLGVDCVVMLVPGDEPLQSVADRLSQDRGVAWSQPMNRFETHGTTSRGIPTPNDRLFAAQPAASRWRLAELHRIATGSGVRVAVIDSMVDARHPDLAGQLAAVRDFVGSGPVPAEAHGTGVAGIIGAVADNRLGIAGVAPGARLLGLRACWQSGAATTVCDSLSLARALVFAIDSSADVINLSLTGPADPLLARLIDTGLRRGLSVVAAVDPRTGEGFPAALPGVIAVASEGLATSRPGVYTAPGRDVPTTEPGGRWDLVSGNSFAAAHVSGLLALARQVDHRRSRQALVSARGSGGTVDACATLVRAGAKAGNWCRTGR